MQLLGYCFAYVLHFAYSELACLAGFEAVDATLSVIKATSCPRFHADHVQLRCLCTYSGEGTFFVPNEAVDRRKWMRAHGIEDTNGFGVKSERHIQQATEWDVVVLKGNAFPGNEGEQGVNSIQLHGYVPFSA